MGYLAGHEMQQMFEASTAFNQPIGTGTRRRSQHEAMFACHLAFNQDTRPGTRLGWDMMEMFTSATLSQEIQNCWVLQRAISQVCWHMHVESSEHRGLWISNRRASRRVGAQGQRVRRRRPPNATAPPATCTDTLASGSTCQPECDSGYTVSGATSCTDRVLTAATCTAAVASCTATQYLTGGACASCPDGSVSRGGDSTICYCPENFYRVVDAGAVGGYVCSACDAGQYRGPGDAVPTARRAARRRGASRS